MCGESRTHSSEGVVEGQPSTTTLRKENPENQTQQIHARNCCEVRLSNRAFDRIGVYIETPHSALGYLTLVEFEK